MLNSASAIALMASIALWTRTGFAGRSAEAVDSPSAKAGEYSPAGPGQVTEDAEGDAARRTRVKGLFQEGMAAYDEGKLELCVERMAKAYGLMPHAAFAFNIGLVREEQGRKARALEWYRRSLWDSAEGDDTGALKRKIRALEGQLAQQGVQQVTLRAAPAGAAVLIDGSHVGNAPVTLELTPGEHQVTFAHDGFEVATSSFLLPPQRAVLVERRLVKKAVARELQASRSEQSAAPATPVGSGASSEPAGGVPASHGSKLEAAGTVLAAAGALALATAGGLEWLRHDADAAAAKSTQRDFAEDYARMQDYQLAARITAGAGAALLVVGGTLWLWNLSSEEEAPATVGLDVRPGGWGIALRGAY